MKRSEQRPASHTRRARGAIPRLLPSRGDARRNPRGPTRSSFPAAPDRARRHAAQGLPGLPLALGRRVHLRARIAVRADRGLRAGHGAHRFGRGRRGRGTHRSARDLPRDARRRIVHRCTRSPADADAGAGRAHRQLGDPPGRRHLRASSRVADLPGERAPRVRELGRRADPFGDDASPRREGAHAVRGRAQPGALADRGDRRLRPRRPPDRPVRLRNGVRDRPRDVRSVVLRRVPDASDAAGSRAG